MAIRDISFAYRKKTVTSLSYFERYTLRLDALRSIKPPQTAFLTGAGGRR